MGLQEVVQKRLKRAHRQLGLGLDPENSGDSRSDELKFLPVLSLVFAAHAFQKCFQQLFLVHMEENSVNRLKDDRRIVDVDHFDQCLLGKGTLIQRSTFFGGG